MNNQTVNYAYLAAMLESELVFLAYDEKFLQLTDHIDRREYIKNIINSVYVKTKEFEKKMGLP